MKKLHTEEVDTLCKAILSLETVEECYNFFEDVCTVKEIIDIAQRLKAAKMLKDGAIFYVAHLPNGAVRYDHFSDAVEAAKKAAAKKAIEEARKRGAVGELVPEVRVNRTMVRDEQSGRNLPIGTVVEAEITQRA